MYIQFYFWTSIPLINAFIPMPVPHCLNYYNLALCFKIRKYESPPHPDFVVLFQDCFGCAESLALSHKFWNVDYFCKKNTAGI